MTPVAPVRIVASGDVIPVRPLPADDELPDGVLEAFEQLRGADLAIGSLEAPLADVGEPWEKVVSYRSHPSRAADVAAMGFDLVSLANNQTMNYGLQGLEQTVDVLTAHGIAAVGAGRSAEQAWAPAVVDVRGVRVACVACTCVAPLGWAATEERGGLAALRVRTAYEVDSRWEQEEPGVPPRVRTWLDDAELGRAAAAVRSAAARSDLVVVLVHWGIGSTVTLADYQRQLAETLVEAGAGLVLGGHPPPLQGVETIGRALVSYSQGTFIRQQPRPPALRAVYDAMPTTGVMLRADLVGGELERVQLVPTVLGELDLSRLAGPADATAVISEVVARSRLAAANVATMPDGALQIDLPSERT